MWTATLGAAPVNLCTWAASSTFSAGVRGTPGWLNTLNLVPLLPKAHDGVSIWCAATAALTAATVRICSSFASFVSRGGRSHRSGGTPRREAGHRRLRRTPPSGQEEAVVVPAGRAE